MISATKKWIFLKISGALLIPLMLWFTLNLISIYDQGYIDVVNFFTNSLSRFLFSLFIINAYFFSNNSSCNLKVMNNIITAASVVGIYAENMFLPKIACDFAIKNCIPIVLSKI